MRRWQRKKDMDARNRLVESLLPYVVTVAKRYVCPDLEFEDLVEIGNLGLLASIDRFDLGRGTRLITYASWWIRCHLYKACRSSTLIRMPVSWRDDFRHGKPRMSGWRGETYLAVTEMYSLDRSGRLQEDSDSSVTGAESVIDPRSREPSELADGGDDRSPVVELCERILSEREFAILMMRAEGRTLLEVGRAFSITKEYARQIEKRAKEKVRVVLEREGLGT